MNPSLRQKSEYTLQRFSWIKDLIPPRSASLKMTETRKDNMHEETHMIVSFTWIYLPFYRTIFYAPCLARCMTFKYNLISKTVAMRFFAFISSLFACSASVIVNCVCMPQFDMILIYPSVLFIIPEYVNVWKIQWDHVKPTHKLLNSFWSGMNTKTSKWMSSLEEIYPKSFADKSLSTSL